MFHVKHSEKRRGEAWEGGKRDAKNVSRETPSLRLRIAEFVIFNGCFSASSREELGKGRRLASELGETRWHAFG